MEFKGEKKNKIGENTTSKSEEKLKKRKKKLWNESNHRTINSII